MANNLIAQIANEFVSGNTQDVVDIITFLEAPWGLGINLYPVQKFILKCFSGDSIIAGDDGCPVPMREYFDKNFSSVSTYCDKSMKIDLSNITGSFYTGEKEVFRLTTKRTKRWIEVTADHEILTPSGYKRLDQIHIGERVVITEREPFNKTVNDMSDWQAGLLGLMVGDGSCTKVSGLVVADGQDGIRQYFEDCAKKIDSEICFRTSERTGCSVVYAVRDEGWDRNSRSKVSDFLYENDLLYKTCKEKRVPKRVFGASRKAQAEFLRCLFATDGGIAVQHGKTVGITVNYTSCNKLLIDDVLFMLRRFGVRATYERLSAETNFGEQNAWQIKINSVAEIRKFFSQVGIPIDWGKRYDEAWRVINDRKRSYSHVDSLPDDLKKRAKEIRKRFVIGGSAPSSVRAQTTGKSGMRALADYTGDDEAKAIGESDICWDTVKTIECVGVKDVYDVSVPQTHNLVVGGIVAHNCAYGMELDDTPGVIPVPDIVNDRILYELSEQEFLQWLYDEGRCNTNDVVGHKFSEIVMVIGRRGSKSVLASCISTYELYKLIKRADPAEYYNLLPGSEISILNVAPTDEQSAIVYGNIVNYSMSCPYLKDRILNRTLGYMKMQSDADRKLGPKHGNIMCLTGGCSSNSLRGHAAIVCIMDEFAFFVQNGGRFSDESVYKSLTPSTSGFQGDGKKIILSSPYTKSGYFHTLYQNSFDETENTLMFKMYSCLVNPYNIASQDLKTARRRDRVSFMCEFGGEFSDTITAWIDDPEEFKKNITMKGPPSKGKPDVAYYMGIDLGFKNDGTSIVIVHKEGDKVILDYAQVWFAGQSDVWESEKSIYSGCNKYAKNPLIKMSDIVEEIKELCRWFPIKEGIFDQMTGYGLQERLHTAGFKQFEMIHFTDTKNHEVYQCVKGLYAEQLLELWDDDVLVPEMLMLEAERKSKNKVEVRALNGNGNHDDLSDAYVRAVWLCNKGMASKSNNIATGAGGHLAGSRGGSIETQASAMIKKRRMHGAHPRGLDKIGRRKPGAVRR